MIATATAAPRQPSPIARTGKARLATSWLTWTPDCLMPTQPILLAVGTRSRRIRLVTPLGKDWATPARAAASSSIQNPSGTATRRRASVLRMKMKAMRARSECRSASLPIVALPMAAAPKQAVASRPKWPSEMPSSAMMESLVALRP